MEIIKRRYGSSKSKDAFDSLVGMKILLSTLLVSLFIIGCGDSTTPSEQMGAYDDPTKKDGLESAVDWSKLEDRNGIAYAPDADKPFSGYAKRVYRNEQVELLVRFEEGYVGRLKQWQKNGSARWNVGYVQGKVRLGEVPVSETRLNEEWIRLKNSEESLGYYDGLYERWYPNGQKSGEVSFKDGKEEGNSTMWHENGRKKEEGNFQAGEMEGLWTSWHENGQKKEEANFRGGKMEGLSVQWYENGRKKWEGNGKDGMEHGLSTWWHPNGQKLEEVNYKEGKRDGPVVEWYPNGQKKAERNYRGGKENGHSVHYNEDGTDDFRLTFKDGKKDGLMETWYKTGRKKAQTNYKDDKIISLVSWKPNGEKCPDTNLRDGNGVCVLYNENGTEWLRATCKDGKFVQE